MKIDKRTPVDKEEAEGGAQATDKGGWKELIEIDLETKEDGDDWGE